MGNPVGDIAGAITSFQDADRQQALTDDRWSVATQNKQLYDMLAADAYARGDQAAGLAYMRGSKVASAATAAYASSNVQVDSKSAAAGILDSKTMAGIDAQTQLNNAARAAWGYKVKGNQTLEQGQLDRIAGYDKAQATAMQGGFQLAGAFSDIGSMSSYGGSSNGDTGRF